MNRTRAALRSCAVRGKRFPAREVVPAAALRVVLAERIATDHPAWSRDAYICRADRSRYRADYLEWLLESERGEPPSHEEKVLESLMCGPLKERAADPWGRGGEEKDPPPVRGAVWAGARRAGVRFCDSSVAAPAKL
ncbi:MAG TPA: hypothetical protein VNF69_01415 [Burkholderiales bacterium]|nr:hypothetical protein [Burkholderiales bacterium]